MNRLASILAALFFAFVPALTYGIDCEAQRTEYAKLNRPLIIRDMADARAYSSSLEATATEAVHKYIDEQILEQLNSDILFQPTNIISRIQCIQSRVPEYLRLGELTNSPAAYPLGGEKAALAVTFEIYRGGAGTPNLIPFFEVFQKKQNVWVRLGSAGTDFDTSTFFVHAIDAGRAKETWFLLSGRKIGDTGSRLHLDILSYDGSSLRSIWNISDLPRTEIGEVARDHIILTGDGTDSKGKYAVFTERWDISPEGLKKVSREVKSVRSN